MALEVVLEEVGAFLAGRGGELPEPLPFRDFVAQARGGVERGEHERYFAELLGDVEETTAPYGLLDTRGDGTDTAHREVPFSAELESRLRGVARRLGTSPATVMHVAWARVLAAVSGREDVVFGTVLFGRMNAGAGADRVPGPFINTLPVRVKTGELGVVEAVSALRGQLAELLEHEHAPLSVAQQASGLPGDAPLFTSFLNYRHSTGNQQTPQRHGSDEEDPLAGIRLVSARERTNYPFVVAVDDEGEGLSVAVDAVAPLDAHAVGLLLRTTAERLVAALELGLEGGPEQRLNTLDVLDDAERQRVLDGVERSAPRTMSAAARRRSCSRRRWPGLPEAVAVVADGCRGVVRGVGGAGQPAGAVAGRARGVGLSRWWGCAWSGASSWSWRCWACGRRAAPTFPSTPSTRPSASPSCWRTPRPRWC